MHRLFIVDEMTDNGLKRYGDSDDPEELADELDLSEFDLDRVEDMDVGDEIKVSAGWYTIRRES